MSDIYDLALESAVARAHWLDAKAKRVACKCTDNDSEHGPCWATPSDDQCEGCKARTAAHAEVLRLAKPAAAAWRKFRRALTPP